MLDDAVLRMSLLAGVVALVACARGATPAPASPPLDVPRLPASVPSAPEPVPVRTIAIKASARRYDFSFDYGDGLPPATDLVLPVGATAVLSLASRDGLSYVLVGAALEHALVFQPRASGHATLRFDRELEDDLVCGACEDTTRPMAPSKLRVVGAKAYAAWQRERDPLLRFARVEDAGGHLYKTLACGTCHTSGVGPSLVGRAGSKVEDARGQTRTFDDAYVTESILHPQAFLAKGYSSLMPPYVLRESDTRAIAAYLRSLPGKR